MHYASRTIVLTFIYLLAFGMFLSSPLTGIVNATPLTSRLAHPPFPAVASNVPDAMPYSTYSSTARTATSGSSCLQTSTYNAGYRPRSLAVGDIDRDGKLDLVVPNWYGYAVGILRGDGNGGFLSPIQYSVVNPSFVALGDLNADGALDLAVANADASTVTVMLNTGSGSFYSGTPYYVGGNPLFVAVADFNADAKLDLAVANNGGSTVSVLLGTGGGAMQGAVNYSVGANPYGIGVGDFDGDGALDLAVAISGTNSIAVLLGTGSGTFGAPSTYLAGTNPYSIVVGDLNGDDKQDIVVGNGGDKAVSVLMGDGNGAFAAPVGYNAGYVHYTVTLGDLNSDGILDIAVANGGSNTVSVLLGTGTGAFQTAVDYQVGSDPVSVIIADLDGDNSQDMAAANFYSNSITVFVEHTQDITPPSGSIAINQGVNATASRNVSLSLAAQDVGCGVAAMAFSNDGTTFSSFEPYASTKAWTLPDGDGSKTVFVKFKDRADNVSEPVSATIVLDQTAPTGSVTINDGAAYTTSRNVTLALSASDGGSGIKQMYLSDGVNSSGWVSYVASTAWTLPAGDGSKTITARFRDAAGNVSAPAAATIILDTALPTVTIGPLSTYQTETTFQVTVVGADTTSGVSSYDLEYRDGPNGAWTSWLIGTTATTASFTGQDGHTYSFRVRARDNAGNVGSFSAGDAQTTVDATAPAADRFVINFGALETTAVNVSLSIGATDATSGVAAMSFSNDGANWSDWQPYAPVALWSLASGDGVKTVYGRFKDAAGNISGVTSDTITLNTFVATDYGLTINDGAVFTNQTTVILTIGAFPGTTQMQVSNDGGFAGVSWEPYTSHKTWQISQYGMYVLPRIVYVRYKDQNGTISSTYQDDIVLDITPPSGEIAIEPSSGTHLSASAAVTLQLSASDDVSGVGGMRVSRRSDFAGASWQPFASSLAWNMGAHETVYVQFRDNAGNISPTYAASSQQQIYLPLLVR